jgi:serine O-acetyltransferase
MAFILHNFAKKYYIDIHPGATIGKACYLDHGLGTKILDSVVIGNNCGILDGVQIGDALSIVIGEETTVGNSCVIQGEVVCGAIIKHNSYLRDLERVRGRRHPVIGNNCFLARGAKILGPIVVYPGSFVPIGAIITRDYSSSNN